MFVKLSMAELFCVSPPLLRHSSVSYYQSSMMKNLLLSPRILHVYLLIQVYPTSLIHLACIGRKYARTDEIGIPFAVTIDQVGLINDTVTLRERDSTKQIRVPRTHVATIVHSLVSGLSTWDMLSKQYLEHVEI
jgi:hypothetical protein